MIADNFIASLCISMFLHLFFNYYFSLFPFALIYTATSGRPTNYYKMREDLLSKIRIKFLEEYELLEAHDVLV